MTYDNWLAHSGNPWDRPEPPEVECQGTARLAPCTHATLINGRYFYCGSRRVTEDQPNEYLCDGCGIRVPDCELTPCTELVIEGETCDCGWEAPYTDPEEDRD